MSQELPPGFTLATVTTTSSTRTMTGPGNEESRRAAYKICCQRGHTADHGITQGWGPTKNHCRWCGTLYWTTYEQHEENAPEGATDAERCRDSSATTSDSSGGRRTH